MNLNNLFESGTQQNFDIAEGRTKELSMDLEDPLMSDEEFETKYGDSRANMQGRAGRVQDRKTGKFYDPEQEFDKLKNSPEFQAQMKRMSEGDVFRRHGKNRNPTIDELEMWIKNWTSFQIGGNLTDAGRAKVGQSIAKAQRLLAKKKQQQGVAEAALKGTAKEYAAKAQAAEAKYLKYEDLVDQELQKLGQRLPQSWDAGRMNTKLSSHPKYALALKYYTLSEKFASQAIRYEQLAKKQGMTEGDDPWGDQGRFAGDTKVDVGGAIIKMIQVGDIVKYLGQKAEVVALSKDRKRARITIEKGMGSVTQDVNTNDLKQLGQGVTETALRDKEDLVAKRRALQDLSRDPGVDQKAVQQRQQDLEKEARSKDLAEDSREKSDPWTDPKLRRKMDYAFGHYAGYKDRPEAFFKWVMRALEHSEQQDQEHEEQFRDIDRAIDALKKKLDSLATQKNLPVTESREIKKQIIANILKESRL